MHRRAESDRARRATAGARSALLLAALAVLGCTKASRTERSRTEAPEGAAVIPGKTRLDRRAAQRILAGLLPPAEAREDAEPAPSRPPPTPARSLEEARSFFLSGRNEGALAFLEPYLARHPKDVAARRLLARALATAGRIEAAERVLLAEGGDGDELRLRMAAVLAASRGDFPEAERRLDRAIQVAPPGLAARGEKIRIATLLGVQDDPAVRAEMDALYDAYEAGRVRTADELLAVAFAALARGTTGAYQDANAVLGEAEALAPPAEGSWIGERIALVRAGMFLEKYAADEAAETLALVLRRNPWHPDALGLQAEVALSAMDFRGAARTAERALATDPGHPDALSVVARIRLAEGARDEALAIAEDRILRRNPRHDAGNAIVEAVRIFRRGIPSEGRHGEPRKWRTPSGPPNFQRLLADLLVFMHLYPEANLVLAEATRRYPKDPALLGAFAASRLRFGDDETARKLLERAFRRDRFNRRTDNILRLYEEQIDRRYTMTERDDIEVRLPKEDAEFVEPHLRSVIAQARADLDRAYGPVRGPIRFEFFDSHEAFSVRTVGVPSLGAAAVCFGHVITAIGPYLGTHDVDAVVFHEMAHVYAIRESEGRVPRWVTEGLAEWEAARYEPASTRYSVDVLAAAEDAGTLPGLADLESAFIRARNARDMEVAYATSAHAMRYLVERFGRERILRLLRAFRDGREIGPAVEAGLGVPLEDLDRDFRAHMKANLARWARGFRPRADGDRPADRTFRKAVVALSAGDVATARTLLSELVDGDHDGYAPRMILARLAYHEGRLAAATTHARKAATFRPKDIAPHVLLARIAADLGDLSAEREALVAVFELEANAFDPAARLLVVAEAQGDAALRDRAAARARAIAPLHPATLAGLALSALDAGRRDEAVRLVDRAAATDALDRGPPDTLALLARAAHRLGRDEQARTWAATVRSSGHSNRAVRLLLEGIGDGGDPSASAPPLQPMHSPKTTLSRLTSGASHEASSSAWVW
ncbi:MAG: hypothetical protein D6705_11640 [Deltaproteobacteria bacterium]|nr:MAG: hypothetical protein D6705_11640 [Deltaproteobacteria bacterium]